MSKSVDNEYFTCDTIDVVSAEMLSKLRATRKFNFDITNSALLVVDMQEFFLKKTSHAFIPSAQAIIPRIQKLIDLFDTQNRPIFFTQHINNESNAKMMKAWWTDILCGQLSKITEQLNKKSSTIIEKTQYDAFYETNLENELKNIKSVVITGVTTNLCCETTARSAFVRGLNVLFPVDTTAAKNINFHVASLINLSYGFATITKSTDLIKDC